MVTIIIIGLLVVIQTASSSSVEVAFTGNHEKSPDKAPESFAKLHSDNRQAQIIENCGANVVVNVSVGGVIIQSPGVGKAQKYTANQRCSWILTAPEDKGVSLQLAYSIEKPPPFGAGCPDDTDHLVITDVSGVKGSQVGQAAFCSRHEFLSPESIVSTDRWLRVEFFTDEAGFDFGFIIVARTVLPQPVFIMPDEINSLQPEKQQDKKVIKRRRRSASDTISTCGGNVVTTDGQKKYIESPGYANPGYYNDNLDCQWKVKSSATGTVLNARVDAFEIEYHPQCSYDILEFYNGNSIAAQRLVYFCGYGSSINYYNTNGRDMTIRFKSDKSVHRKGFRVIIYEESVECKHDTFNCQDATKSKCISLEKVCDKTKDCPNGKDEENCQFPCGIPYVSQIGSKIVGGEEATAHAFPWQVAIFNKGKILCGASIINRNWLLTAAHCTLGKTIEDLSAKVGKHKIDEDETGDRHISILTAYDHASFDKRKWQKDVAVLLLARPIQYTAKILPICLPPRTNFNLPTGVQLEATGWGTTKNTGERTVLRRLTVPNIASNLCKTWLGSLMKPELMICAGYEKGEMDTCQGDSGGPLVWKYGGKYIQVGITSWGKGCAEYKHPGAYTRVTAVRDWITNTTRNAIQQTKKATFIDQPISTPYFPQKYANYVDMIWEINADTGRKIRYHFVEADIEYHKECKYDFVRYFVSNADDKGKKLCGSLKNLVGTTVENTLIITFHSDKAETGKGFNMLYRQV